MGRFPSSALPLVISLCVLLSSCGSVGAANREKNDVDIAIELANRYGKSGESGEQKRVLLEAFGEYGYRDPRLVYNLCVFLYDEGDYADVAEKAGKAYGMYPAHLRFQRIRAAALERLGKPDEAVGIYESIVSGYGATESDVLSLCRLYDELGMEERIGDAVLKAFGNRIITKKVFERASAADPDNLEYRFLAESL